MGTYFVSTTNLLALTVKEWTPTYCFAVSTACILSLEEDEDDEEDVDAADAIP
jgi:hypothetical protein